MAEEPSMSTTGPSPNTQAPPANSAPKRNKSSGAGGPRPSGHSQRRHRTISHADRDQQRHNLQVKSRSTHSVTEGDYPPGAEEYLEGTGTPTPSEKVSRWHRDIFLVSPTSGGGGVAAGGGQQVHPRQCICDQCMAEYGTFKFYNQMLQEKDVIKEEGDEGGLPTAGVHQGAGGKKRGGATGVRPGAQQGGKTKAQKNNNSSGSPVGHDTRINK